MKKIVLLGLQTDTNLGDVLISQCTEHLVSKALSELGITDISLCQVDMRGFDYRAHLEKEAVSIADEKAAVLRRRSTWYSSFCRRVLKRISPAEYNALPQRREEAKRKANEDRVERNKRYRAKMAAIKAGEVIDKNTAALIIVGGGFIKFGHKQRLPEMMRPYIDRANSLNIPVMFNSVGVEGYNAADPECQELCRLLNLPCVKSVTTRDDIDTLNNSYITNDTTFTALTPDPAMWTPSLYPGEKAGSGVIGLGLARSGLYRDHGGTKSTQELLDLWSGVITLLEQRGYDWKLFSNGLEADWSFGKKLLQYMDRGSQENELLLPNPSTVEELVDTIRSFDCIAASRLHAAITAISYGIPVVEIVWNVKQRIFAQRAGLDEFFIDEATVTAESIVGAIEKARDVSVENAAADKIDTYRAVYDFLKQHVI